MYTRILIATDGSDLINKGIDHCLAKRFNADVTVVTVTEPLIIAGPGTHAALTNRPELVADIEKPKPHRRRKYWLL